MADTPRTDADAAMTAEVHKTVDALIALHNTNVVKLIDGIADAFAAFEYDRWTGGLIARILRDAVNDLRSPSIQAAVDDLRDESPT